MFEEKYWQPVSLNKTEKVFYKQFKRIKKEWQEADEAYVKWQTAIAQKQPKEIIEKAKLEFAKELGDVVITTITTIRDIDYNPNDIMKLDYEKNLARGYYD